MVVGFKYPLVDKLRKGISFAPTFITPGKELQLLISVSISRQAEERDFICTNIHHSRARTRGRQDQQEGLGRQPDKF
ncbi:hypothetical protein SUGI_0011520 [Cryptomeria japonica]|nr:hypothetical protein SUGI_0011520 [Cryptomeria japonica]